MKTFLIELFIISLLMSLVVAAFLLLSKKLEGSLRARGRFIIWLVIIARLAIPVGGVLFPTVVNIPVEAESTQASSPDDNLFEPVGEIALNKNDTVHTDNVQNGTSTPNVSESDTNNKLPTENINDDERGEKSDQKP